MTDELKPCRCGCRGEARLQGLNGGERWYVYCRNCHTDSDIYDTEAEAVAAWNRAMGAKDINVPNKVVTDINVENKIAKVVRKTKTYDLPTAIPHVIDTREEWWDECENCNKTVQPSDRYCSHCGARLEWE